MFPQAAAPNQNLALNKPARKKSSGERMKFAFAMIAVAFAAALLLAGCVSPPDLPPAPPGNDSPPAPPNDGTQPPIACSADAKVCPDGTVVGREGADCHFAPCPANGTLAMTKGLCESARGSWNGCASACRGAPENTACTLQCVQQCECGGIDGFGCPQGYECKDYLPAGAADAMGVCRKI